MKFNQNFAPDDILKIDTETGEVTLNGVETYQYSGSLPVLSPNTTTLIYTDSETGRDLTLQMEYQERDE